MIMAGRQEKNIIQPGRGNSHMKVTDVLVVSFRGLKHRFWYHSGCSGRHADIFSRQGFMVGCMRTVT